MISATALRPQVGTKSTPQRRLRINTYGVSPDADNARNARIRSSEFARLAKEIDPSRREAGPARIGRQIEPLLPGCFKRSKNRIEPIEVAKQILVHV